MADKSQSRSARRKQKKTKKKPLWKKIVLTGIIIVLAIGIGVGALFTYYIATAPTIDASKLSDPFPSVVLDQSEEVVDSLGSEQRTKVEYDDLPQVLIDAVVATEDSRYFKHHGIDLRRIGGAIKANITNGFGSEGASTITQQVVERSFLSPEKKIKIKVQEQWLALKLERKYSKEEILEMYLNKIFYGSDAYGVAKAAETYFGKTDLHDLTVPEAAILAGLPQRPTAYNPYENPDLTKSRMETVLKLMVRHGKITEEEAEEARQVDIESLLVGKRPNSRPYEAFIQQVRKEVEEKVDGADIYTDGLKIYTTLDQDAQEYVEFLLTDSNENPIPYPEDVVDAEGKEHQMQAGMTVLDTSTGAIQAIGGRRNSENNDSYNYAINGGRQPGSTFKPIVAFAPAIEYNNWSTYHQINDDKPYEVGGSTPIRNWNREYQGWMSARTALSKSLNVPTVKALEETGTDNAQKFAEGLGIKFYDDRIDIRDAIGGTETEVNPLQLAGAYSAFGNEGIYNEPYAVTKVEFPDGKTIDLKPESEAAMSDHTAYMVTDMLKTAMSDGTGVEANIPGLPVAGKTGTTTRDGVDGSPDSWFSGYTTDYTISIWTGYDDNNIALPDTKIPHALFKNTMTELSKNKETKDFVKPSSVVEVEVEKGSNPARLPSENTPSSNVITELFVKGHEPSKTSEKYDKLDPVSNLTAAYDEDSNSIKVEWDYDSDEDVSFEVSASINDGGMQSLSSTEDKSMEITEVEEDSDYEIQVVAVSKEDSSKSDPKTTKVKLSGEEDDDAIPSVSNLNAGYDKDKKVIDVSWEYDGPAASFEVAVSPNEQTQTVSSNGIEISGISPGQSYTIRVTPVGTDNDEKGESKSTEVSVPADDSNDEPEEDQDNSDTESDDQENTDAEKENTGDQEEPEDETVEDNEAPASNDEEDNSEDNADEDTNEDDAA